MEVYIEKGSQAKEWQEIKSEERDNKKQTKNISPQTLFSLTLLCLVELVGA